MNFYSWYYKKDSSMVSVCDAMQTLEQHDKRFHPDGYKEGDVCTLRDTANKQDLLSPKSTKSALSIFKNWLPGVKVVEDEDYAALESSYGNDIRTLVKTRDWDNWKTVLKNYVAGLLVHSVSGVKRYYPVLSYIPDVAKKCFEEIGIDSNKLNSLSSEVRIGLRAIAKSVDMSNEIQEMKMADPGFAAIQTSYVSSTMSGTTHTHGIPFTAGFGNLPVIIDNPIAVFRSDTGNRTILLLCDVEDEDPAKTFRVGGREVYSVSNPTEPRHQYAVVGLVADERDPSKINVGSFYGKCGQELQSLIHEGQLLYVNRKELDRVKDQLGQLHFGKLAIGQIKTQVPTQGIKNKYRRMHDYEPHLDSRPHSVINEKNFKDSNLGQIGDELFVARRNGDWNKMRKIMNDVASAKGYSYNPKLDRYVNQNGESVSADFDVYDDYGHYIRDFVMRFNNPNKLSTRCRIIHKGEEPVGWYDRDSGEVHLISGKADAETIAHELGWHASFHYAEKNNPELYAKMMEYAKNAPEEVKQSVIKTYGKDLTEAELLDEIGARRFTEENLDPLLNEIQKRNAKSWFGRVTDGVKSVYRGFLAHLGGNRVNTERMVQMTPEDCMAEIAKAMVEGKTLSPEKIMRKMNL